MSKYCAGENQSSAMFKPGERFHRITSRSASLYGRGCNSSALATLKIDVLAPMPMAKRQHGGDHEARVLPEPATRIADVRKERRHEERRYPIMTSPRTRSASEHVCIHEKCVSEPFLPGTRDTLLRVVRE